MPSTPTPNLSLTYPLGTEAVSSGPTDYEVIVNTLDGGSDGPTATRIITGTLVNFTATYQANPASYALGTLYVCTDVDAGFIRDSTPAWRAIPLNFHSIPIGSVQAYAATVSGGSFVSDPDGMARWRLCDGGAISRETYSALFGLIGTTYGAGDGTTTFNVPNLQNRFPLGAGTKALAQTGGSLGHTHDAGGLVFTVPTLTVNVSTNVGSQWVTGTVPGLTVNGHTHTLSGNGWAYMNPQAHTGNLFSVEYQFRGVGQWGAQGSAWASAGWNYKGSSGNPNDYAITLGGSTDSDGAATQALSFGTGWMSTSGGTYSGSGSTGASSTSGASGATTAADPPYQVLNYLIKVL